ncbi:Fe3+-citrate ABC transporter substrate-binding protein [Vibrio parahaemolyticus]|nr:Fe3+-citrate ABC transporter substrate-binding protein [Vibrio parahaemolyticus]
MATANYQTNTGERFISESKTAFKIHIPKPEGGVLHRSVGFVRIGKKKGLRKAIKKRDIEGSKLWEKHWKRVLNNESLITRLPHNLEPTITPNGRWYVAMWSDENGVRHCRKRSIDEHGKLAAYVACKKEMLKGCKGYIDILLFMGRLNTIDLK